MALSWNEVSSPTSFGLSIDKCIWVPELLLFVGVGYTTGNTGSGGHLGRVITSPDGLTWNIRDAAKAYTWTSVTWSPSLALLVAVSSSTLETLGAPITQQVMTSPDGINWTDRASAEVNQWQDVVWSSSLGLFVAVAQTGTNRVMTSVNGTAWSTASASSAKTWGAIAWSGTEFVATAGTSGTTSVMRSTNGTAWADQTTTLTLAFGQRGITYSAALGKFAAWCKTSGPSRSRIQTSTDGTTGTWTDWAGVPSGTNVFGSPQSWDGNAYWQIAWSPELSLFVATGDANYVLTSPDGVTWTWVDPGTYRLLGAIAYSPTKRTFALFDVSAHDVVTVGTPPAIPWQGPIDGGTSITVRGPAATTVDAGFAGVNGGFSTSGIPGVSGIISYAFLVDSGTIGAYDYTTTHINVGDTASWHSISNLSVLNGDKLTGTVPGGNGTEDIIVVDLNNFVPGSPNVQLLGVGAYTYTPPVATSISPSSGPAIGGTSVTVTGTNFFTNYQGEIGGVSFGGDAATNVTLVDSTTITCVTPAHAAGVVDVIYTPPRQLVDSTVYYYTPSTLSSAYTYVSTPTWWHLNLADLNDIGFEGNIEDGSEITLGDGSGDILEDSSEVILMEDGSGNILGDVFDEFPFSLLPFDLPDLDLYIWQEDEPDCPLKVILQLGVIPQEFYDEFVDPNDGCILQLHIPGLFTWPSSSLRQRLRWDHTPPPANDTGWWLSVNDNFAGAAYVVLRSRPKDVRTFREISAFANGSTGMMGGFPGPAGTWKNHLIYAPGGYTVGVDRPTIRINDGNSDREVVTIPDVAGVVSIAVMSILVADGIIYLSTLDSGTSTSNWSGRVFSLDIETGILSMIGAAFPTGHVPYALAWHMGRLWCGTHRQASTDSGKIYFFRPGVDTSWTADYDLATSSLGSVTSLLSFKGLLYAGTTAATGTFAKVLVRGVDTTYSVSDTGTGGTARANNGYLALAEFGGKLYASFWNPDNPAVSLIRSFNSTAWSTAYTGASGTLVPYVGFPIDEATMLAIGGGIGYNGALVSTADGVTWADRSAFLTQGPLNSTGIPAFGTVVL